MRLFRFLSLLLAFAVALPLAGCNSTNPVEPAQQPPPAAGGGSYTISLAATPGALAVGGTEPATVTVTAVRVADNQPAAGVRCALSTSLGSFDPGKDLKLQTVTLNASGTGQARLYPRDATAGSASVLAQIETSVGQTAVAIQTVTPAAFFLTAVSPNQGGPDGGELVEITGGGFADPVRVTFGTVVASGAKVVSPTRIQVFVPRPATVVPGGGRSVVDVAVTNALDQPAPATDTLTGGYAYSNEESSLLISGISPQQGSYRGGTLVTITGNGFEAPVEVRFGGVSQTVVSVTPTQIQARTLPVTLTACNPSSGPVSVTNLRTGLSAGSGLTFSYTVDPLFLERASPANAGQDDSPKITITGSGFPTSPSSVRVEFGTTVSQNVLTSTATKIEVLAPIFTGPFDTQACDSNHDGTAGQQNIPTGVNLKVQNLATGCADTLLRGFIFVPDDTTCSDASGGGSGGGGGGGDTPPTASFTYSVFDKTVQFTDTSTGGATSWFWDFGEDASSATNFSFDQNPVHTYRLLGTYTVKLRAGNSAGTSTKTMTIKLPP
jgi:hypothetical protein